MRILSLKTVSWLGLILGLFLMFGCGSGSSSNDSAVLTSINLNGGDADPAVPGSVGGSGGLFAQIDSASTLTLLTTANTAVTVPTPNITPDYGAIQHTVSGNETIQLNAGINIDGLHVLSNNSNLYLGNGDGDNTNDPVVTGLLVPNGTTLTLPDNYISEFYVILNDDIVIDGELNTVNVSSEIGLDSFNGNLIIGSTGVITTKPSVAANGGDITLFAGLVFINQGTIDASGFDGGNGLTVDIIAFGNIFNSGTILADGGDNLVGTAGDGGTVSIYSDDGNLYTSGNLIANGGIATNGTGGLGGSVYLETFGFTIATPRDMMIRGTLQANGGDAINGNGGHANFNIELLNQASVGSRILVDADLSSRGGASTGTGFSGGDGFQIIVSSTDGAIKMTGNIDISGGDGELFGGESGWFFADTLGTENIELAYEAITLNGGIGDTGGDGGDFLASSLSPGVAIVSDTDIFADGGDGVAFGGDGGYIELDSEGTVSVSNGILSVDAGSGSTPGFNGNIDLNPTP